MEIEIEISLKWLCYKICRNGFSTEMVNKSVAMLIPLYFQECAKDDCYLKLGNKILLCLK